MADFKKHKELWNDVVHGTPTASLAGENKLNQLGEMSENTFQVFLFASLISEVETKGGKSK